MVSDYSYSKANFKVPDMPVSPPEPDDETYDRNIRNSLRSEAMMAAATLIMCLDDLGPEGDYRYTQKYIEQLRDYLEREMED
jgi:hypothetical protein